MPWLYHGCIRILNLLRSKGESGVFVLDPDTDELLHYEPVTGYPPTKVAEIPREVLQEHPEVEIRYDLIDCSIDVCSVEVSFSPAGLYKTV